MMRVIGWLLLAILNGGPVLIGANSQVVGGNLSVSNQSFQVTDNEGQAAIQGIVTWVDPGRNLMVLQDGSRAQAVRTDLPMDDLSLGDRISLTGKVSRVVAALPDFPNKPSGSEVCHSFEAPTDSNEFRLTRMRGYLRPPVTGKYTFWIASDDSSELW